jgi:hypothetical protein
MLSPSSAAEVKRQGNPNGTKAQDFDNNMIIAVRTSNLTYLNM